VKPKLRWHRTNKVQHYDKLTALFTVSSATGANVRSSNSNTTSQLSTPSIQGTLIPVTHRIRTRGVPLQSDSEPSRKRVKTTNKTDEAINILVSVLKDQQGSGRVRFNTVELAIQLLQKEYETRLSEGHFLEAVDFLTTEAKASVFITLNSGIRDVWLCKNTHVSFI
jgi:hypothetical protein